MKIIESSNIFNDEVNKCLKEQFNKNKRFIYISATDIVFRERAKSLFPSDYFKNGKNTYFLQTHLKVI